MNKFNSIKLTGGSLYFYKTYAKERINNKK